MIQTDERRIRHLKATVSQHERATIDHAITLWQAMHGKCGPITPDVRGSVLAAIVDEWQTMTRRRSGTPKGGRP
jgi:hypothetical protein